jgi:hypothetical protein
VDGGREVEEEEEEEDNSGNNSQDRAKAPEDSTKWESNPDT